MIQPRESPPRGRAAIRPDAIHARSFAARPAGAGAGQRILTLWKRLRPLPLGRWIFMRLLARMVPYSDSVHPRITELAPGFVRIEMKDRHSLRNHLGSIHAIAIANLGELASGLAMTTVLPPHIRGIVTNLNVDYLKKARGLLTVEASGDVPEVTMPIDHFVYADIRDESGASVAHVTVTWRLARK
jgi:acyl-coenzyme A thioesterase PaaI-like protein